MKKRIVSMILALATGLMITGCGAQTSTPNSTPDSTPASDAKNEEYTVGICQIAQHPALDAATQGFMDAIEEALPGQVHFQLENASNDIPTCGVICTGFAANGVDLILANATPSLQAAVTATTEIPILGTAVTEYGVALDIDGFDGVVGGNVSGTSDLAPLDQQAAMVSELFPEAKNVGILYCSAEPNSAYQAQEVEKALKAAGLTVNVYTFADSNDVAAVAATACGENDVLYTPTDNTVAICAEAINNVAETAGVPIICGEVNPCKVCGVATLSIDYYELGRTTGEMAVDILTGKQDISTMPIGYYPNPVKMYNPRLAEEMNVTIPEGYIAIEE